MKILDIEYVEDIELNECNTTNGGLTVFAASGVSGISQNGQSQINAISLSGGTDQRLERADVFTPFGDGFFKFETRQRFR